MLQPASATPGAPRIAATTSTPPTGIEGSGSPPGETGENQSVLDFLPCHVSWAEQVATRYETTCADTTWAAVPCADPELALFYRRLAEWRADQAGDRPGATGQQVEQDLRSALIAAIAIGMAHGTEMVLIAFSSHPLVRVAAVSHPYVLSTFLESTLKRMAGVQDPDPGNRTGIRYQEKMAAALINWNAVQPALDNVLTTPLSRSLKVMATAVISAVRDVAERANTKARLQELPADAPPGPARLTDAETLFVNCLMCWLRNAGVDLVRHAVRSGGEAGTPIVLPAARGVIERLVRPVFLGRQVPGALPAAAIASQPAFGDAVRGPRQAAATQARVDEILQQSHQLF